MKSRHRLVQVVALAVVVAVPLLGMSGIAAAAKKGSPTWCANHPKAAPKVAACSALAAGGTGAGGSGGGATTPLITVQIDPNPLVETADSDILAIVQVETSPSFAGDPVLISSSQLNATCGFFEFAAGGPTETVTLDDDGNATSTFFGEDCAPGTDTVAADLTVAPYYTALGTLVASPPVVTTAGVAGYPTTSGTVTTGEVETGDTPASGDSDVFGVFYVETDPVYAEQPVEIASAQLEDRCGGGWEWLSPTGIITDTGPGVAAGIGPATGPPVQSVLDDDGNAVFFFFGSSCGAGPSEVIADVEAGTHTTYTTTFNVDPPQPTI